MDKNEQTPQPTPELPEPMPTIDDVECIYGPPPGFDDDYREIDDVECVYGPPPGLYRKIKKILSRIHQHQK